MRILNLTQHAATPEQLAAGVVDLTPAQRAVVSQILTFETLPSRPVIQSRARLLAQAAADDSSMVGEVGPFDAAMIGGAPYLMGPLEDAPGCVHAEALRVVYPVPRAGWRGWFGHAEFVALQAADFKLHLGQTLGIIGESGSGKSSLALAALGLIPFQGQLQIENKRS